MTRRTSSGIVLTSRDLFLFETLVTTRILDSSEVMAIAGFTSIRRANRRLLKLVRAGLLRRWFVGTESGGVQALYGLSLQGSLRIGGGSNGLIHWKPDSLITSSQFLAHQRAVNAVFLEARVKTPPAGVTCGRWSNFKGPLAPSVPLVPDGYFEIVKGDMVHAMFLEVDLGTETSTVWTRKVEMYLKFAISGEFQRLYEERRFRVLVLFHSDRRLQAVRKTVVKRTDKLFWFSTQGDLKQHGLWQPIWLRPSGSERLLLLAGADAR
jgi:hypothetical protein